jgi:SAP domain-containing new25/Domain of unknown function (DUF6434)
VLPVTHEDSQRPVLSRELTGAELLRWYWSKDELAGFARSVGARTTGGKELLTRRLAAVLDGVPFDEPVQKRPGGSTQLSGTLSSSTLIPRGQRCSQLVRAWFAEQVGGPFRFDGEMRAYFAAADGTQTLQDALDHYRATRGEERKPIDAQFEYNRFTRAWYERHPAGSRPELLDAWRDYRDRPVDDRGRA